MMKRPLAIAGLGFTIVLVGAGAAMLHPMPALLMAVAPSAHKVALALAAMTFVVAAVIDHDR